MSSIKDFNSDIIRYNIPHSCNQCTRCYDCYDVRYGKPNPQCRRFIPSNMDMFLNDTITYFNENVPKSKDEKLNRVCSYNGATNDKVTTLDKYYVDLINDSVQELRNRRTAYIFNIHQLYDIVQFYGDFTAKYQGDGIIALIGKKNTKEKIIK